MQSPQIIRAGRTAIFIAALVLATLSGGRPAHAFQDATLDQTVEWLEARMPDVLLSFTRTFGTSAVLHEEKLTAVGFSSCTLSYTIVGTDTSVGPFTTRWELPLNRSSKAEMRVWEVSRNFPDAVVKPGILYSIQIESATPVMSARDSQHGNRMDKVALIRSNDHDLAEGSRRLSSTRYSSAEGSQSHFEWGFLQDPSKLNQ
jgi:hypothetical protein